MSREKWKIKNYKLICSYIQSFSKTEERDVLLPLKQEINFPRFGKWDKKENQLPWKSSDL
jgi:hypothetical protein